ncbi:MAG: hypothetical protein SFV51_19125 [Bryobacteraceae bacterium]|nr:hypothetical protein [Bryobacteraceae bacterium]
MAVTIVRFGVDFRGASIAVREQLGFTGHEVVGFLAKLPRHIFREAMLVATCNRTELYALCEDPSEALRGFVESAKSFRPGVQPDYHDCLRFQQEGEDAARQLFRVTAGLESQILGDSHILTQVREAMEAARRADTLGPVLRTSADSAIRAAKLVRKQTGLSAGSAGIGAAVLRSVRKWRAGCAESFLIAGAGQAARDIAHHVAKLRPRRLAFTARRGEAAAEIAACYSGIAAGWADLGAEIGNSDVIVTATPARLDAFSQRALSGYLTNRPRLIIDAGLPRNVDPEAAQLPGVTLVDLDSLEREQSAALAERARQIPAAEAVIAQELVRWRRLMAWREVEPEVKSLYLAAEHLRASLAASRQPSQDIDRITSRLVNQALAGPVRRLRSAVFTGGEAEAARALAAFRLMAPFVAEERT